MRLWAHTHVSYRGRCSCEVISDQDLVAGTQWCGLVAGGRNATEASIRLPRPGRRPPARCQYCSQAQPPPPFLPMVGHGRVLLYLLSPIKMYAPHFFWVAAGPSSNSGFGCNAAAAGGPSAPCLRTSLDPTRSRGLAPAACDAPRQGLLAEASAGPPHLSPARLSPPPSLCPPTPAPETGLRQGWPSCCHPGGRSRPRCRCSSVPTCTPCRVGTAARRCCRPPGVMSGIEATRRRAPNPEVPAAAAAAAAADPAAVSDTGLWLP